MTTLPPTPAEIAEYLTALTGRHVTAAYPLLPIERDIERAATAGDEGEGVEEEAVEEETTP